VTIREIMQLPRGTFREIRKNQNTGKILEELERERFSGICHISFRDNVSTLVLKAGKCILAEYETFKGDAALEHLTAALADKNTDTALSTLTDAQIQLSLEFNKSDRIKKAGYSLPESHKSVTPPVHPAHRAIAKKTSPAPKTIAPLPVSPKITVTEKTKPNHQTVEAQPVQNEGKSPSPENTGQTDEEIDLDALDVINLDQMTEKIRDECKTMVKKLHMDHLIDKD